MRQEVTPAGRVDGGGDRADSGGAQPEVHPLRTGPREQCDGLTALQTEAGKHIGRGAGSVTHLREGDRDAGDRHHHAVAVLLGAAVENRGDGEALDVELGRLGRPGPGRAHHVVDAAGSGRPSAVYPKSIGVGSAPG
jgi:hypothetical protein